MGGFSFWMPFKYLISNDWNNVISASFHSPSFNFSSTYPLQFKFYLYPSHPFDLRIFMSLSTYSPTPHGNFLLCQKSPNRPRMAHHHRLIHLHTYIYLYAKHTEFLFLISSSTFFFLFSFFFEMKNKRTGEHRIQTDFTEINLQRKIIINENV